MAALAAVLGMSTTAVAATTTAGASLPTVNVSLNGKSVVMPKTVKAGAVSFSVTTTGEKQSALSIVRLDPGVSVAQAFSLVQSHHGDPNALIGYASIITDFGASASSTPSTVQTVLTPGRYAALDLASNGQPPATTFTVAKSASSTSLPKPGATMKAEDFAFEGPSTLHDGELVRFENVGYVTHMQIAIRFKDKAAARKAMALLKAGKDHPAGKLATGAPVNFMGPASPGAMQQQTITATPGVYVMACFMQTTDGREHTTLGMLKLVTIAK